VFEEFALKYGFYSDALMKKLAGRTSIQDVEEIPKEIRRLFVTAFDVSPEWHVKMQAAFQKYVDNAVSKTINMPSYATPQDVEEAYMLAYKLGCKGITILEIRARAGKFLQLLTLIKEN
jgi:ribonucleoside-diphosphate reductase alpha chain